MPNFIFALIVWNVGQGQWVTEINSELCIHYDLGGEKNVISQVLKHCQDKQNILLLSHWDWDHISWAPRFAAKLNRVCLESLPVGKPKNWKLDFLAQIPVCQTKDLATLRSKIRNIYRISVVAKNMNSNELSQVVESTENHVLIPGDSTISQEFKWRDQVSKNNQGIVLGHHGSKTSTSNKLIENMPNLKWAVASARWKRYGHPHQRIVSLLKKNRIPLLKTEDWGNLYFLREN